MHESPQKPHGESRSPHAPRRHDCYRLTVTTVIPKSNPSQATYAPYPLGMFMPCFVCVSQFPNGRKTILLVL
ncbi:hypothetical protein V5799_033626 [Amblyomma americanum]|uniref:Uncharacterized protein n=1 Tax=Amblyomma americanum TaxID=6943 RepID=A0AAQ4DMS5_AMBAM